VTNWELLEVPIIFGVIPKKVGCSSLEMKMGRTGDGGIGRQKR